MRKIKEKIYPGNIYHILNRGNDKQNIFFEPENYLFFMRRLRHYVQKFDILVICYCLMPNHFHLCLEETVERGISRAMLGLQTSYAKAINKRRGHTGHVWQDTFKYVHVDTDEYLLHLTRYIHLNPVKAGMAEKAEDWEFSSYRDYIGLRRGTLPKRDIIWSYFSTTAAYRQFVEDYQEEMMGEKYLLE
ncbi:transposase IS200 like protein [bacterium BMS3Bbin03]|nr:transposase IS200 like protein [bacterium BMS3Bbin03]